MTRDVGMSALAVAFPTGVRTNDWWIEHHPDMVASASERTLARVWSGSPGSDSAFQRTMEPYLSDPFRGSIERRWLGRGETSLSMELDAARRVLSAANRAASDIDLAIIASFVPDQIGVGNAAFFVRELGLACPAWNLESACSSAVVGLNTAVAIVRARQARRVLVAVSCSYSREASETDTLSWFLGDGAGAFLVEELQPGYGWMGAHTVHTAETCSAFRYSLIVENEAARVRMLAGPDAGRLLRDYGEIYLRQCCAGAAEAAGVALSDIDFFVFNTPTAWYAAFAAESLGIAHERTISVYPEVANVGPVLMPANLHRAASTGRIRRDDLVMLYAVGSVSTASAVVMRWGSVDLAV
jgi:3-oxoacyl-[acyl-carrier-protein] synthase-3